jgi:integrase
VREAEGVSYLRITDEDGRQLKNEQSRRDVPLHPELIRLGFLDYVAEITAQPQDQVFPELRPGGKDRKLGYYFSKRFSEYRAAIGVRRRGLDYHSFRHGVTTKLYQADVSEAWIDLLTGHDQGGGESRRRYLKGVPLPQLREALERVRWSELDLTSLHAEGGG